MTRDVEVLVYDKAFGSRQWIGDPIYVTATPRHNQQPTATIALAADDPKVALLSSTGARCVIRYRDEHMVGGPVRLRRGQGISGQGVRLFDVADDWRLTSRVLLWQVPGSAITAQSASEYHIVTGPAETVVKTLLGAAITRMGLPVTVATDLGRGATISVQARMSTPVDVLYPLADQAGIGITVRQVGAGLVLDCYEPADTPITLSEKGGTLTELDWSISAPEVTRVVAGFDGEGTARHFRTRVDAALEAALGDVIEVFVDARDLKHDDPGFEAAATARMQAAIAAGSAKAGLSVSLAETSRFRYGGANGVHVGDPLTVPMVGGPGITDVLREATLTWSKDGTRVTPVIGDRRDDPDMTFARAVASVARAQRTQQTRS